MFVQGTSCSTPPPPALPAGPPRYALPGSHLLDPAYQLMVNPLLPFPRRPWPFETESRAPGTGLIASFIGEPCSPSQRWKNWRRRHYYRGPQPPLPQGWPPLPPGWTWGYQPPGFVPAPRQVQSL